MDKASPTLLYLPFFLFSLLSIEQLQAWPLDTPLPLTPCVTIGWPQYNIIIITIIIFPGRSRAQKREAVERQKEEGRERKQERWVVLDSDGMNEK